MILDGMAKRALAKVCAVQARKEGLAIDPTLAQACQGAPPGATWYAYLESKGLLEWTAGAGFRITDKGEAELRRAGIEVP